MTSRWFLAIAVSMLAPVAVFQSEPGFAQDKKLDEIVVYVRRKDESLQEIPIAVSTLSEQEINRLGISDLSDVVKYSPDLQFDEGFGAQDTRVVIRGLSPTRGRSNVALLVDGVDFTGEAVSTAGGGLLFSQQLLDIERVEIVKGPQSALYGRSAFAGAVQYITKLPSLEENEGTAAVEYSTGGSGNSGYRMRAGFGGPLTDKIGLRVNTLNYDEDGYYKNSITGGSIGGSDGFGIALSGLWEPSDKVRVEARVAGSQDEYEPLAQARPASNRIVNLNNSVAVQNGETTSLIRSSGPPFLQGAYAQCTPGFPTDRDRTLTGCFGGAPRVLVVGKMPDADDLTIELSDDPRTGDDYPGTEVDTISSTFTVKWDTDAGQISSYTGFSAVNSVQFFDGQIDALPPGTYTSLDSGYMGGPTYSFTLPDCGFGDCSPVKQEINFANKTRLFSQEFRFASDLDGGFNYTVGALYWKERVSQDEDGRTISPAIFRDATSPSSLVNGKPPANSIITSVFTPMPSTVSRDTESLSAYAQLEFDLSETIKLTVEGRYIDEELEVSGPVCDIVATPALSGRPNQPPDANGDVFCDGSFRGSSSVAEVLAGGSLPEGSLTKAAILTDTAKFDDSFIAPKAILEWAASDSQLFYASIGKGIKPGGISTITAGSFFRPNQNTFDKEELWSYELGSKSTLLDGDLVVNSSLFYQDYSDKQVGVSRFDPVIQTDVGSIENAGEAEIYGFEIEAIWRVTDALTMSGGYTFVDAEYTDFVIETSSANNVARSLAAGDGGCLTIIDNDPAPLDGQSDICIVDLTDNEVEDVPKHSFVGNLRYQAAAGDTGLEWFGGLTTIYRAERFMDEFNIKELDSYWLTDARAGLIGDNWELTFFVDNVFDDDTVKSGVDFGSQVNTVKQGYFPPGPTDGVVVSLPDPRVVGARLNFTF